uniref:Uncharacterized protein n=1 Tax=Cannabis sativa TaxID=3483 RepID=A0A803QHK9_CANSA
MDTPEDIPKDDPQNKTVDDDLREKNQLNKLDPVVIMAKQLLSAESRLTHQDQFNEILLRKVTRMEGVMTALTKETPPYVQAPPTTDASERAHPKDPGTSGLRKDKRKGIVVEIPKKTTSTNQHKKSKTINQPKHKKKGNHA